MPREPPKAGATGGSSWEARSSLEGTAGAVWGWPGLDGLACFAQLGKLPGSTEDFNSWVQSLLRGPLCPRRGGLPACLPDGSPSLQERRPGHPPARRQCNAATPARPQRQPACGDGPGAPGRQVRALERFRGLPAPRCSLCPPESLPFRPQPAQPAELDVVPGRESLATYEHPQVRGGRGRQAPGSAEGG